MFVLTVKDMGEKSGVSIDYKSSKTNTLEHLSGILTLYKQMKKYSDITDDEIIEFIKANENVYESNEQLKRR